MNNKESENNNSSNKSILGKKVKLLSGRTPFTTKKNEEIGLRSMHFTDGPLGTSAHSMGFAKSHLYPCPLCIASTFDPALNREVAINIGKDAASGYRSVVLAPGINIIRTPLCGRAFEYYSEDPLLTSQMAVEFVRGLQSQHVAACPKHLVGNSQEYWRTSQDSIIPERALYEVYLKPFLAVIGKIGGGDGEGEGEGGEDKERAMAWTVMSAYNRLNGVPCVSSLFLKGLLDSVGFDGVHMSDWLSTFTGSAEDHKDIWKVLDLEMPLKWRFTKSNFLKSGDEKCLDDKIKRMLLLDRRTRKSNKPVKRKAEGDDRDCEEGEEVRERSENKDKDKEKQQTEQKKPKSSPSPRPETFLLIRRVARQGIILLRNENRTLPINIHNPKTTQPPSEKRRIILTGKGSDYSEGGLLSGGSSGVRCFYYVTPAEGIDNYLKMRSSPIELVQMKPKEAQTTELTEHDVVIYISEEQTREGKDRKTIDLAPKQWEEIVELRKKIDTAKGPKAKLVLVLSTRGVPSSIPDVTVVDSLIACISPGMEAGNALADILFGKSPCGCLPVTMYKRLEDCPAHKDMSTYPGTEGNTDVVGGVPHTTQVVKELEVTRAKTKILRTVYREGVNVGYRHTLAEGVEPLFPFGHGLTYTEFEFADVEAAVGEDTVVVQGKITNTGGCNSYCVIQIYFVPNKDTVTPLPADGLPPMLVGFIKVKTVSGGEGHFEVAVRRREMGFWDETQHSWRLFSGKHKLLVGLSSTHIIKVLDVTL